MTFSKRVHEPRYRISMAREQLAKEQSVAFSTVNRWEKGKERTTFLVHRKVEDNCKLRGVVFKDYKKEDE